MGSAPHGHWNLKVDPQTYDAGTCDQANPIGDSRSDASFLRRRGRQLADHPG